MFPHPDDEALFAGGLLADAARRGAHVQLLCLTRGEAGHSRHGERGELLAARRLRELGASAQALGVSSWEQWDWPDGGLHAQLREQPGTLDALSQWLRAARPHVLVSFGADGAYGHADHVACHDYVRRAAGSLDTPARLLDAAFDPGALRDVHRRLQRFLPAAQLPVAAETLGSPARTGEIHVHLDEELRALKRRAVAAHDSQLPRGGPEQVLAPGVFARLCEVERYLVRSGPPLPETGPDPFAGLTP